MSTITICPVHEACDTDRCFLAVTIRECDWYALCENEPVGTTPHPILGDVDICQRCAGKHDLPVTPYES